MVGFSLQDIYLTGMLPAGRVGSSSFAEASAPVLLSRSAPLAPNKPFHTRGNRP